MKQSINGYDMPVLVEAVAKRRYERDREALMASKNWQEFPPTWDEMTPQQRHAIKAQVSTLVTDVVECLPSDEPDEPLKREEGVDMSAKRHPEDNNALRIIADYELMSDEPPRIWADIVFGHAKEHGLILDYEVVATATHFSDLTFLVFTVTAPLHNDALATQPFNGSMEVGEAVDAAKEFLTALLNEPPSVRWVEGVRV